ncbi:hypothetical protein ON010_g3603 [Phytophthora cinnamomi]|nr:hypothetical protein ON010_g3603 [Phytophthora cinnamomi]
MAATPITAPSPRSELNAEHAVEKLTRSDATMPDDEQRRAAHGGEGVGSAEVLQQPLLLHAERGDPQSHVQRQELHVPGSCQGPVHPAATAHPRKGHRGTRFVATAALGHRVVFLTVIKMGFVFTGRMGTGLVVARLPDGRWSAPSAIGTAGVGWGPQIGGEITDFVIILNTQRAVEAFCASGQVNLGAELGISAGPVGRVASGALEASASMDVAPCYSYSHSKGLYAGISLEGSVILSRSDINRSFYGKAVTVAELLGGVEPPPVAAAPLYDAIRSAMESPANGANRVVRSSSIPAQQYQPGAPAAAMEPATLPPPVAPIPVASSAPAGSSLFTNAPVKL